MPKNRDQPASSCSLRRGWYRCRGRRDRHQRRRRPDCRGRRQGGAWSGNRTIRIRRKEGCSSVRRTTVSCKRCGRSSLSALLRRNVSLPLLAHADLTETSWANSALAPSRAHSTAALQACALGRLRSSARRPRTHGSTKQVARSGSCLSPARRDQGRWISTAPRRK